MYGVLRKNDGPYELSDAWLDEKAMDEKERSPVDVEVSVERSRYIPPPLFAEQDENEVNVTETVLVAAPVTYIAPPFPDDAVHDVNVVLDSAVPVMESVFPASTDPEITAPFTGLPERERFAKEHDVIVTPLDASKRITGAERVTTVEGVNVTEVRLRFPEETEKRE